MTFTTPPAPQSAPRSSLWLRVARAGWLALVAVYLAVFVLGLPARWRELTQLCQGNDCAPMQLTPVDAAALSQLRLTVPMFAYYQVGLEIVLGGLLVALGFIIVWRMGSTGIGLLVSLTLIAFGANVLAEGDSTLARLYPHLTGPVQALEPIALLLIGLLTYLFPDGKFVPRWTWLLALPLTALAAAQLVMSGWPSATAALLDWLYIVLPLTMALGLATQVYRYRTVSDAAQRQQTKWVLMGLLGTLVALAAWEILVELFPLAPGLPRVLFATVGMAGLSALLALLPVSLVVSMLRYRLWDIDLLIRRTLVYSALTAVLAGVYIASIIVLQSVVLALTGQQDSPIVTVLSTLTIAALFVPARRWLQDLIDRRFYRQRYDAQEIMTAFSTGLAAEVDLEPLRERLLAVVEETIQPEAVSLWLREPPAGSDA